MEQQTAAEMVAIGTKTTKGCVDVMMTRILKQSKCAVLVKVISILYALLNFTSNLILGGRYVMQ